MTSAATPDFLKRMNALSKDVEEIKTFIEQTTNPAFTEQGSTLLRSLKANIESARAMGQAMASQVNQLNALTETAALLNSSLEPDAVLQEVIDALIRLTGAERAFIVLDERGELRIKAARNWDAQNVPDGDATFSRSIIRATMKNAETVLTTNAQSDERFAAAASVATQTLRSVLCVPLMSRGKAIGVIYADNRLLAGIFDQSTVAVATLFAQQAGIAIENAQMFAQVQNELATAKRQLQELSIVVDEDKRAKQVADITDSAYFQHLQELARKQRNRGENG